MEPGEKADYKKDNLDFFAKVYPKRPGQVNVFYKDSEFEIIGDRVKDAVSELIEQVGSCLGYCGNDGKLHEPTDFRRKVGFWSKKDEYECERYSCNHTVGRDSWREGRGLHVALERMLKHLLKTEDTDDEDGDIE